MKFRKQEELKIIVLLNHFSFQLPCTQPLPMFTRNKSIFYRCKNIYRATRLTHNITDNPVVITVAITG